MKRLFTLILLCLILALGIQAITPRIHVWLFPLPPTHDTSQRENITIIDDTLAISIPHTQTTTITTLLETLHRPFREGDSLWPGQDTPLTSGMTVTLRRSKTVQIETKEGKQRVTTTRLTGEEALADVGILLDEHDISLPDATLPLAETTVLKVIRVVLQDQVINKSIPFEKTINEDPKLSWRKNIVTQKGVAGNRQLTYRITSYDGKEISRKLIDSQVTATPVTEISTQGTYVEVGKASTGLGSWYAWTGTLAAANPWLPIGSYVRVTNQDNGKQVIVKINDRGPNGPNRIIDLDKVAFEKIASLGAGIINVKMEPITN